VAQLCQQKEELDRLNAEVLVIGFGAVPSARAWLEQTCDLFPLLLDPEREVYRTYRLQESWLRSWNVRTIWLYVRLLLKGRKWRGILGKSTQLGGDFIVDADGVLRLVYPSREATDRPLVSELLALLHKLKEERKKSD
jgi:alkyl hydroperoxide reductase subunit AhpC